MSREQLRASAAAEVDRWEQALTDELLRLFDRQQAVVLARLQGTKARKHTRHWYPPGDRPLEVKQIIDPLRWVADAVGSLTPVLRRLFTGVYGRVSKSIDPAAPAVPPEGDTRIEDAVKTQLDNVAKGVENAVREVEDFIAAEEAAGTPMPAIVSGVQGVYSARQPVWAERIATLSAVGSINQSALFAAADRGAFAKQWLCFEESTRVAAWDATHVVRRFHDGPLVRLTLRAAGGLRGATPADRVLTVTPDHLVLTRRGWVEAQSLKAGEHAFGSGRFDGLPGGPDVEHLPPTIAEVFSAAQLAGPTERVVSRRLDFNGEKGVAVLECEVDVVPIDGALRDVLRAHAVEQVSEFVLGWSDEEVAAFYEERALADVLVGVGSSSELVGCSAVGGEGVLSVVGPAGSACLAVPSQLDVGFAEYAGDGGSAGVEVLSEGADGGAFGVAAYEVVNVDVVASGGHVYDLSTSTGWLLADGTIAHNSRRDDKVRATHEHADGQVRLLDERFRLGGIAEHPAKSLLLFPGDPSPSVPLDEVMRCRCTLIFSPPRKQAKAFPSGDRAVCPGCGDEVAFDELDGWQRLDGSLSHDDGTTHSDHMDPPKSAAELEVKDRVRTPAGAAHYGQPIGSVIVPGGPSLTPSFSAPSGGRTPSSSSPAVPGATGKVVGRVAGGNVELAGGDPQVRALVAKYSPSGVAPDPATSEVLALRDRKGRIGAYVVWATADGSKPKGTILQVSVHPALQGQRIGDQLVQLAAQRDPSVKPTTRPSTSVPSRNPRVATPRVAVPKPSRAGAITSRAQHGDRPGTSGDFDADAKRIERLQQAYMRDRVDTTSLFSRGGRWTAAREKQQQAIIDHFLTQPGVKKDRKILILGGLPGAGKTTTINSPAGQHALGIDLADYVTVNADEVKAEMVARGMVPDYPGLSADESATLFHAESFEIAHSLMRQAAKQHLNFAYDTSLKTAGQVSFATGAAARMSPPPWETTMLFVDVPLPVAKQRARDRYLAGGRYMPLALIDGMRAYGGGRGPKRNSGPAQEFDSVKSQAARWVVVDNAGAQPVVVAQGGRNARRP